VTASQIFIVFDDRDIFEEQNYFSPFAYSAPQKRQGA
jgi:hypothetical protein